MTLSRRKGESCEFILSIEERWIDRLKPGFLSSVEELESVEDGWSRLELVGAVYSLLVPVGAMAT